MPEVSLKIFHNPRCSKSRATLQLLTDRGLEPEVVLYLENPPGVDELEEILEKLGRRPRELMRTGEQEYRSLGLDDVTLSDRQLVETMVKTPKLIERPIVLANGRAAVGRPPESVLEIL
ncbi:MAG: arsenate reductase (glutaredoxin) [Xanthomonadales bacterium]|nr:arsenate reductase (glutaredoxin) [Gammaproteobacteria bacterium]NNE06396.1 arsenate reductase (glutaredoxin) [Xanthomonadales bacterium]NNL94909.1 arsenate reductase (glutaredoxin) [Xanthomonadales bacterium]